MDRRRLTIVLLSINLMLMLVPIPAQVSSLNEFELQSTEEIVFDLTQCSSVDWDRADIVSTAVTGMIAFQLHNDSHVDFDITFFDRGKKTVTSSNKIPVTKEVTMYPDGPSPR